MEILALYRCKRTVDVLSLPIALITKHYQCIQVQAEWEMADHFNGMVRGR